MMETFWLVWEPQNGYTKNRHGYQPDAKIEAERLAERNPGKEYFVLQALTMSTVLKPVQTIELSDLPL